MTIYKTCTEYWLDPQTGAFRGEFEAMYQDIADPWGCEAGKSSLNNQIFLDIIFDANRRYDRILDIGCGLGALLNTVRQRNQGGYVLGVDVSRTAIQKAKERYPELHFDCRNIAKERLEEGDFDLVVLSEVLWYILDDLPSFFSRVAAMLRPAGLLAIHQYFPAEQRFGRERVDGLPGFLQLMERQRPLLRRHMYTNHHPDGLVLLSTFQKEK